MNLANFQIAATLCRKEARRMVGRLRAMKAIGDFSEFPEALSNLKNQKRAANFYASMDRDRKRFEAVKR